MSNQPSPVVTKLDVLEKANAAAGSQYVTFHMPDAKDIAPLRLLGETVVPAAIRL